MQPLLLDHRRQLLMLGLFLFNILMGGEDVAGGAKPMLPVAPLMGARCEEREVFGEHG